MEEGSKKIKFKFVGESQEILEGTLTEDKHFWGNFRVDHDMSRYSINMVEIIEEDKKEEEKLESEEIL
ncbi:MAG: hypothetical protein AABY15_02740 [Nanoarchaeota archaeon]